MHCFATQTSLYFCTLRKSDNRAGERILFASDTHARTRLFSVFKYEVMVCKSAKQLYVKTQVRTT